MARTNRVKELRIHKGWKQIDLVKATGLSQYTVSEIENHKHNIKPGELEKLSNALEVPPNKIYKEEGR